MASYVLLIDLLCSFLDPHGESQERPKILLQFLYPGGPTEHRERLIGSTGLSGLSAEVKFVMDKGWSHWV